MKKILLLTVLLFSGCTTTSIVDNVGTYKPIAKIWDGYGTTVPDFRNVPISFHTNILPPPTISDFENGPMGIYYDSSHGAYFNSLVDYRKYIDKYLEGHMTWYRERGIGIEINATDLTCKDFRIDKDNYDDVPVEPTLTGITSKAVAYEIYKEYSKQLKTVLVQNRNRMLQDYESWMSLCIP